VKTDRGLRLMLILGAIGVYQFARYVSEGGTVGAIGIGALVLSLAIGAGLSAARAATVHVWWTEAGWMRKGNALTLVLWLVSIGSHVLIDWGGSRLAPAGHIGDLGNATIVLYLAVVLGLQNLLLTRRVGTLARSRAGVAG
jgi:hypothetical protein